MEEIVVGIDVGTTKVCTLVGRVEGEKSIRIIGVGIEPSDGIRKGVIVDLANATQAIKHSVERAEQTSGLEITSALISLAGGHVSSINSRGAVAIPGGIIDASDVVTGARPGACDRHSARPRDRAYHPARLQRGRTGRHPRPAWYARLTTRSGSAYHHRCGRHRR